MAFHNGDLKLNSDITSSHILDKVIGYVGPGHSLVAVPLASVMNEVRKIYISYSAMSSTLSDRQRFPYFMRFCSPDYKEANVIMELAKYLDAKYVQIIYSDEEYGIKGKEALLKAAREREICVANTHPVLDTSGKSELLGIISEIRKFPHAKVIIVFLLPHTFPAFLKVLTDAMKFEEFALIGGDGWSQLSNMLVSNKLRGSFTMTQKLPNNNGFDIYFKSLNILESQNPWLQDVMEARANCYYPKSFNKKEGRKPCTAEIMDQHRETDTWVPFIINTVYALALGFNAAVSSVCGGLDFCPEYLPEHLIGLLKTIQMDIYNENNRIRIFDDNGEGNVGYTISQVVKVRQTLTYREVGRSTETGIDLSIPVQDMKREMDVDFTSSCQNDVECSSCRRQFRNQTVESKSDVVPIATASVAAVLFFVIAAGLIIYILCRRKVKAREDPYLSVIPDPNVHYEMGTTGNHFDGEDDYARAEPDTKHS